MSAVRNADISYSVHKTVPMNIVVSTTVALPSSILFTLATNLSYFYALQSQNMQIAFVDEGLCILTQSLIKST